MSPFQNNAQPPSAPNVNSSMEGYPGQSSDLYAQIAGEDREVQVVKKKNRSFLLNIMALFMRATLYIDSLRRTHELFFHFLGVVWTLFMALLYCSGILMLVFSVYNRMQLPIYLEDQLRLRNVEFETADYGMDRIIVRNLRDKDNTYTVDQMIIYSTFTDLLQKRIRLVVLDGLNIFIDTKSEPELLDAIPQFLSQIQNPTKGKLDITVNALTVNSAKLTFKNRQVDVPVSFSMEGIYTNNTQIVIPLSVDQPSLQMEGTLTVGGERSYPEWTLSISKGKITLPRSAPEDLSGELKVTLDHQVLDTVQANFKIGYGTIEKQVAATLKKKEGNSLSGQITWEKNNLTEPEWSSNVSFGVDDLTFSTQGSLRTQGRLVVDSKQFFVDNIGFRKLHAPLNANLVCQNWAQCELHINEKTSVSVQELWFPYQRQLIRSRELVQFDIMPQQNAFFIYDGEPYLTLDLPVQNLVFKGMEEGTNNTIDLESASVLLKGALADADSDASHISLKMENFSYQSSSLHLNDAVLDMENMLQTTAKMKLQAKESRFLDVPLLRSPFNLDMSMVGNNVSAQLNFKDLPISMQLDGKFVVAQKAFSGKIYIPPFKLEDIETPLHSLWPNIPDNVTSCKGEVAVNGQMTWLGLHNISGPIQIGMKDVSFDMGKTHIKGLNTVVMADSLAPFSALQTQHMFIQSVDSLIPLQNIDISFQADSQNLKLSRFAALGAGLPLTMPSSIISMKNANLLYLKNESPITPNLFGKVMNIPGIDVSAGTASLSIPIETQGNTFMIPNITMKLQNVLLQRTVDDYAKVFENSKNYFVRTGQIIMDDKKILQVALSGRLLPSKKLQDVQLNEVSLPEGFFKTIPFKAIPADISQRLDAMFRH